MSPDARLPALFAKILLPLLGKFPRGPGPQQGDQVAATYLPGSLRPLARQAQSTSCELSCGHSRVGPGGGRPRQVGFLPEIL